jgi:hypothetical protein
VFQAWMAERIFSAKQTLKGTLHVS